MSPYAHVQAAEPSAPPSARHDAFRAAGRHTSRVRFLRRFVLAAATVGVALVLGLALFNPLHVGIPSVSIDGVGLDGTRVTMDHPKLTGFRSDGRPYSIFARNAVQDAKTPNVLELHDLDAHVTMSDKTVAHVVSTIGVYDSSKETMVLKESVHLTSDSGYDVRMSSAYVEFKSGVVDTREPLTVVMSSGTVSADAMHMSDNGKVISFEGHVRSVMTPAATAAATVDTFKGKAP